MGELPQDIVDYARRVSDLEATRLSLVERLNDIMVMNIIPDATSLLPEHYSIDAEGSKVCGAALSDDSIPFAFNVELRLLYDGESIQSVIGEAMLKTARVSLEPKLNEMAKEYGISILIVGKPL